MRLDRLRLYGATVMLLVAVAAVRASGCRAVQNVRETRSLVRVGKAEDAAFRVYRHGTDAEAKHALLNLIKLLEAEEAEWKETPHGKGLAFDLSLTYGRLSLLAEKVSDESGRRRYLELAGTWYRKSGQPARDDRGIRELVLLADRAGDRGDKQDGQDRPTR